MIEFNEIRIQESDFNKGFLEIDGHNEVLTISNNHDGYPEVLVKKDVVPRGKTILYFYKINTPIENLIGKFVTEICKFGCGERYVVYQIIEFKFEES
jgi:hypothetical protein